MRRKVALVMSVLMIIFSCFNVFAASDEGNKVIQVGDNAYAYCEGYIRKVEIRGTGEADLESFSVIRNLKIGDGITHLKMYWNNQILDTFDLSDAKSLSKISSGPGGFPNLILPRTMRRLTKDFFGTHIYIENSITIFPYVEYIDSDPWFLKFMPNATIRGYTGSYAETYADKHDIIFESIGHIDDYDGPKPEPVQAEVGETFTYKGLKYKVMSVGEGLYSSKSQVRLLGREKDSGVRISIPNTVLYKDQRFRVTSVYTKAFYKDTSLRGVTFGKWVNYIGSYSFYGCSRLSRISITGDSIFKSARESLTGIYGKCQVTVPKGKVASYRTALRKYGLPTSVKVMRA